MTASLYWAAVGTLVYTYAVFPLLVLARAVLWPRAYRVADTEPTVTVLIAARNEEEGIAGKLDNLLGLDYPGDRLEVIVASDGSEDRTTEIVGRYADRRVRVLALPRGGKAAALNAAAAVAAGEILVFSDANSMYAPDAIRALVRPFADPGVGGVAGDQRYLPSDGRTDAVGLGEQRYWSFDRLLKVGESRAGNVISATGAIYAVRRALFRPIPDGVTDDFATSTAVVARGARLVFAEDAVAFEPVSTSGGLEFERKVRIMTRGLRGVVLRRELLDVRRHGFYAVQLLSHKVLRRLMVFPLLVVAATSPSLWRRGRVYRTGAVAQAAVYGAGALGLVDGRSTGAWRRVLAAPAFFCMVNAAALKATWNVVTGRRIDRWEPRRAPQAQTGGRGAG